MYDRTLCVSLCIFNMVLVSFILICKGMTVSTFQRRYTNEGLIVVGNILRSKHIFKDAQRMSTNLINVFQTEMASAEDKRVKKSRFVIEII